MEKNNINGYEILSNSNSNAKIDKNSVPVKMQDTVSVVMTFYNAERFLEQAMLSVVNQVTAAEGMEQIQIDFVLVNDCSTDNSDKIAKAVIDAYKKKTADNGWTPININYITSEKNLGCGGARKLGIENAVGDYIMFLDADDYYINLDFVTRAHFFIKKENADIVEFGVRMNQEGQAPVNSVVQQSLKIINRDDSAEIAMFNDNIIKFNVWSKIYKKSIVDSHPYSDSRTFEDVRTVPYWLRAAKEILVINTVEVNYRASSGSIIRENIVDTRLGTISAIASLFPDFKNNINVLKAMYNRAMVDINALCNGHSEENEGFSAMSKLNTEMLKYIYPNAWAELTFNPDVPELYKEQKQYIDKNVQN